MASSILKEGARILFQGDSITDAGWDRGNPDSWGGGYVMMVASHLSAALPERDLTFRNRGISGNRVYDMEDRWTKDCVELRPTCVSFLIGINDTWRRYDSNLVSPADDYEASFHRILERTRQETGADIVICEPFVLPVPPDRIAWREDLDPRIAACRRLAVEFNALYVPFDGIFAAAATRRPASFWLPDGVHPSLPGHALMAHAWIKAVRGH